MSRVMPESWLLPAINDHNRGFFTSGKILVRACADCGTIEHPPEDVCHACQGTSFVDRELAGKGHVYSHTVIHHPVHPALKDAVPYTVILVSLDDAPDVRITGNLIDAESADLRIGLRVRAVWEEVPDPNGGEPIRLPQWEVDP